MKAAAGHDEVVVSHFPSNLATRPVHVAQAHAELLAADAKAITGAGTLCHPAYLSVSQVETPLILIFTDNSRNRLTLLNTRLLLGIRELSNPVPWLEPSILASARNST